MSVTTRDGLGVNVKIVVECNNTRRVRRHREEGVCKLLTMSVTTRQELGVNARKEVECNNTRRVRSQREEFVNFWVGV